MGDTPKWPPEHLRPPRTSHDAVYCTTRKNIGPAHAGMAAYRLMMFGPAYAGVNKRPPESWSGGLFYSDYRARRRARTGTSTVRVHRVA